MTDFLEPFESIGENCEFGFVQRALGHEVSSFLRWTFLDSTAATIAGISTSFAEVFKYENLEPAAEGTMVRDRAHGIAFHTSMHAKNTETGWDFLASDEERRVIHAEELRKIDYLRDKFDRTVTGTGRIYVAKRCSGLSVDDARAISEVIGKRGGNALLYVTTTDGSEQPGTVRLVHDRMAHGIVERFAPHTKANDISLSSWEAVLRNARSFLDL
jgi:hypothetical protein